MRGRPCLQNEGAAAEVKPERPLDQERRRYDAHLIDQAQFDSPGKLPSINGFSGSQPRITMETLSRFSMVKSRIW